MGWRRGVAGEAGRRCGRLGCGAAGPGRGRRRPEVGDGADGWAPSVKERKGERSAGPRGGRAGPRGDGPEKLGRGGEKIRKGKERGEVGWAAGESGLG
jgi:hypothetical protein